MNNCYILQRIMLQYETLLFPPLNVAFPHIMYKTVA
jgi:hypothetical protein